MHSLCNSSSDSAYRLSCPVFLWEFAYLIVVPEVLDCCWRRLCDAEMWYVRGGWGWGRTNGSPWPLKCNVIPRGPVWLGHFFLSNCCHQDSHYHCASGNTWTSKFVVPKSGVHESSKVCEGHAGGSSPCDVETCLNLTGISLTWNYCN